MDLHTYIKNHSDDKVNKLPEQSIDTLTGFDVDNLEEIKKEKAIIASPQMFTDQEPEMLKIISSKRALFWYYMWGLGIPSLITLSFFIYPIMISNYWFLFGVLLAPLAFMASPILPSPMKSIFTFIVVSLTILSFVFSFQGFLPILFGAILIKYNRRQADVLYRDKFLKLANEDELAFKFFYAYNLLQLVDKQKLTN